MFEKVNISYQLKIIEVLEDGFRAVFPDDKRLIKNISIVKDTKALKNHSFRKDDIVDITLELAEKKREDIAELNKVEYYIGIKEITSNGMFTKSYDPERKYATILWYESRGMITSEVFEEKNRFEIGDLIKVTIRRR